jgi:hypothetical protein
VGSGVVSVGDVSSSRPVGSELDDVCSRSGDRVGSEVDVCSRSGVRVTSGTVAVADGREDGVRVDEVDGRSTPPVSPQETRSSATTATPTARISGLGMPRSLTSPPLDRL